MDKRYQVFLSSTFTDLKEERQQVLQTLVEMDCIPAGMELFPATDEEQWKFIQKVINDCDYYLLIIGGKYGSLTADGISYTEQEFDYTVKQKIPILAFMPDDPDEIIAGKSEMSSELQEKLNTFKSKVCQGRIIKKWKSPEQLSGAVAKSLPKMFKTHPAVGWVRADTVSNTELLEQINTTQQYNEKLRKELESVKKDSSPDIGNLSFGNDEYLVTGTYKNPYGRTTEWDFPATWNELFSTIGVKLFMDVNEETIKTDTSSFFINKALETSAVFHPSAKINDEVFQTIKIQLLALKLITVKPLTTVAKSVALFWVLTEYGKRELLKIRSIKSDQT